MESSGKELDSKLVEISEQMNRLDITKEQQKQMPRTTNKKLIRMDEKLVARSGKVAKDQDEVQRLSQEISSNKEEMRQLQEKHDATLCETENELRELSVTILQRCKSSRTRSESWWKGLWLNLNGPGNKRNNTRVTSCRNPL